VRLAVDPALLEAPAIRDVLVGAVRRLNRVGLAVVISIHPNAWYLETSPADRDRLHAAWQRLAPALRRLDPARVIPELLNEPVFPGDPAGWHRLQQALLAQLRADLPASTIVLTGHDWSSIAGLQALMPEADSDVVYGFHFYDPPELTSLAAYRAGLDRAALARLPFPADDPPACDAVARPVSDPATRDLMRYYCALHWDHARIRARIDAAADWARRHNVVLLAGEFGASIDLNAAARLAWLRTVRDRFEANGIGWALWGYDDRMGLGIQRPPGNAPLLPAETLQALGLSGGAALGRRHGFP
ncbi:MAG: glycoside hydrolase family 5 protein, partial [Acetobacteraceae bacterium]